MARILLADDNLTTQKVFQLSLEQEDSDVRCFNTGQALLAHLGAESAELVALNLSLPDGNGYDLCRQIKSNPLHAHIPVVLLVGAFQTFDEERAVAAGCTRHLSKPFETSELVEMVGSLLDQETAREDESSEEKAMPSAENFFQLAPEQARAGLKLLDRELHLAFLPTETEQPAVEPSTQEPRAGKGSDLSMDELLKKLTDRLPNELSRILPRLVKEVNAESESPPSD